MNGRRLGFFSSVLVALAGFALATGCGSGEDAPNRGGNQAAGGSGGSGSDDDAGDGGSGGDGGAGGGGGEPGYLLEEVCDALAEEQCKALETCCTSSDVGYDEAGCKTAVTEACEAKVAKVGDTLAFWSNRAPACVEASKELYGKCQLSWAESLDLLIGIDECRSVFTGTKFAGEACTTAEECHAPADASMLASCEGGKCAAVPKYRAENDPCIVGGSTTCALDLYCNANSPEQGAPGKCEKIKAVGAACNKDLQARLECGIGNHCHPQASICVKGKAAAQPCTDATAYECESYTCNGGQCAPLTVATAALCKGETQLP